MSGNRQSSGIAQQKPEYPVEGADPPKPVPGVGQEQGLLQLTQANAWDGIGGGDVSACAYHVNASGYDRADEPEVSS